MFVSRQTTHATMVGGIVSIPHSYKFKAELSPTPATICSNLRYRLPVLFCLSFLVVLSGCGSKNEEVAMATPAAASAPPPPPHVDMDSGDGAEMSSDSGDGGGTSDDGSGTQVDDGSGSEPAMTEDSSEPVMTDEPMTDENMTMNENDGEGAAPAKPPEPPKPKTLREQAVIAFSQGYDKAAVRLLQAHMLSTPAEASEILAQFRWSQTRKQPALLSRIAVGVDLKNPYASQVQQNYKPIGSVKFASNQRNSRRREQAPDEGEPISTDTFDGGGTGGGADSTRHFVPGNDKERVLQKYAGMMGDGLVDHVRQTHAKGLWSPFFQNNAGVFGSAPTAVVAMAAAPSSDGSEGDFSDEGSGSPSPMSPTIDNSTLGGTPKLEGSESKYISIGPSMSFVGVNASSELIERAKEGGFDALIIYDVEISLNLRLRLIYNECKARLVSLVDGKTIAASKPLKNTEVQKELDKPGNTVIEKTMAALNAALDEKVALTDFPSAITADIIKSKRLPAVVADTLRPKLDRLAEIRLWREKNFLTDGELASAFSTILGPEDGRKLASGTDDERKEVALKLLGLSPA